MGKLPSGEEVSDVEMMQRPDDWPAWPVLPLVKRGRDWASGGLIETGDSIEPVVYLGNIYVGFNDKVVYDSFEAIAADGWVVD